MSQSINEFSQTSKLKQIERLRDSFWAPGREVNRGERVKAPPSSHKPRNRHIGIVRVLVLPGWLPLEDGTIKRQVDCVAYIIVIHIYGVDDVLNVSCWCIMGLRGSFPLI